MGLIDNRDAQFMLLAAFIVGIGLVITTVMLNSIIFESNLAIDAGNDPSKNEIVNLMEITRDEMRNAYRNGTEIGNSLEDERDNFTKQMQNFSANIPTIYAKHGEGVNVTWNISNWNDSRHVNFTENGMAGSAANWTVVYGVTEVDTFKLYVYGGEFIIKAINQSNNEIWNLTVNNTINSPPYVLNPIYNFTNATNDTNNKPYSIYYENGNDAWGYYYINGTANNRTFVRARNYVLNTTVALSTSRIRANITIPVTVPW